MFQIESKELLDDLIKFALADKRGPRRWHITRLKMYLELESALSKHDSDSRSCLCISQSQALADVLGIKQAKRTITKFPDVNLLALPYADNHYDFVLSDQVLEHVEGDPFLAAQESVRVAKPGAWIVHTTCFINFMHMLPLDFWRFTPQALDLMMKSSGAEVVKSGGWGNRAAWTYMQLGYRGEKIPEVPGNPIYDLSMRNEPKWPVVTWIIARKTDKKPETTTETKPHRIPKAARRKRRLAATALREAEAGGAAEHPIQARMTDAEIRLYSDRLAKASDIIEFGCGGSTLMAIQTANVKSLHSVESDKAWIEKLRSNALIAEAESTGRLFLHHVDIGPTKAWGKPVGAPKPTWRDYYEGIWNSADIAQTDLVFVDGRFRVQCALMAAIRCRPGTIIAIHDYFSRPYYSAIEPFFELVERVDDLAVFATKDSFDRTQAQAVIDSNPYRVM